MSDDIIIKVKLDNGQVVSGLAQIEKQAKKAGEGAANSFNKTFEQIDKISPELSNALGDAPKIIGRFLTSPLGAAAASLTALAATFAVLLNQTLAGEKLNKIEKTFNALSDSFGVAGESLKNDFIASLDGLVDDSDAIESLNKAFVTLGDKVTQLPQVMDIARKATNLFGGEVTDNFEKINQAIAIGATRQLRGLGLVIDADKAYKEYAKSIGVTKDELSEQGRQQAILNAILEKGGDKFKNVSSDIGGATSALTRLTVSFNNIIESFQQFIAKNYGDFFASVFEKIDTGLKKLTGNFTLDDKIKEAKKRVDELNEAANNRRNGSLITYFTDGEGLLTVVEQKLRSATKRLNDLNAEAAKLTPKSTATQTVNKDAGSIDADKQAEKLKKDADARQKAADEQIKLQNTLTSFLINKENERIKAVEESLKKELDFNKQRMGYLAFYADQEKINEAQKNNELSQYDLQYKSLKISNEELFNAGRQSILDGYALKEIESSKAKNEQLKLLDQAAAVSSLEASAFISTGYDVITDKLSGDFSKTIKTTELSFINVAKTAASTIGTGVTKAFSSFGQALGRGEDAGKAFMSAMGDMLAGVASQFGEFFIQNGVARVALSYGTDATGYAMIAAGIALNALAGSLSSKSSSGSTSSDSGGGIASSPSQTTELTPNEQLRRPEAQPTLQVNIQGDILDSDETGSRIIRMLQDQFDLKGARVVGV